MSDQIKHLCKVCYLQLRSIYPIRKYLNAEAVKTLLHAFVTSRLDYGNGLLYGIPKYMVKRLQLIQNTAARLVVQANRYSHITPILKQLHWLPIKQRIKYKILLTVFKCIMGKAPAYLQELLVVKEMDRDLRSKNHTVLQSTSNSSKSWGDRAFSIAGPRLWNRLPTRLKAIDSIEVFKKELKTLLFSQAFK